MTTKDQLKALIDQLPADRADRAQSLLIALMRDSDPWEVLPVDDEPLTVEDQAGIQAGLEAHVGGDVISQEDVLHDFGLQ